MIHYCHCIDVFQSLHDFASIKLCYFVPSVIIEMLFQGNGSIGNVTMHIVVSG